MGAKQVDNRDNGHTAKSYGNPLGIECEACGRHALVPLDRLGNLDGNMRPLKDWPFKCSACGSRDVSLWLFAKARRGGRLGGPGGAGFLDAEA